MDYTELFKIMSEKGFQYLDGSTTKLGVSLYFSTGFNTRGNAVEVIICEFKNSVHSWIDGVEKELQGVSEDKIFEFINEI